MQLFEYNACCICCVRHLAVAAGIVPPKRHICRLRCKRRQQLALPMPDRKLNIVVRSLTGTRDECLNVQDSITVEELWGMLFHTENAHQPSQDLLFNGKVLSYKRTLYECKVVDGSILHIIFQIKKRKRDDQISIQVNVVKPTGKIIPLLPRRHASIEEVKDLIFFPRRHTKPLTVALLRRLFNSR
jgi:hypothetical protein